MSITQNVSMSNPPIKAIAAATARPDSAFIADQRPVRGQSCQIR